MTQKIFLPKHESYVGSMSELHRITASSRSQNNITEKQELLGRWKDYFITLLNEPLTEEQNVAKNIQQAPT